jgi:hypothetical protein
MTSKLTFIKSAWIALVLFAFMAVTFGLAYTQPLLYDGNQNTKFLHGLAQAGMGYLKDDWLAQTVDPLPAFSFVVSFTYLYLSESFFYFYYILIFGIYAWSLAGIASHLFKIDRSLARYLVFFAALLALHSDRLQILTNKTLDLNMEFLQFGLAGQYLLGPGFQNSVFGVFLLLSIYLYLERRYILSILAIGLTGIFHSAYLLSAGLMTAAYMLTLLFEKLDRRNLSWANIMHAIRKPLLLGLVALALVAPVLWYNQVYLSSTSAEAFRQSIHILVHERIPHHSLPNVWWNRTAYIQIGLMLVGLFLARRSRLFAVLLALMAGGLVLTLVQIFTGSDSLAMLAPWRVSVLLVPISTALILAWLINLVFDHLPLESRWAQVGLVVISLLTVVYLARSGLTLQNARWRRYLKRDVISVMNYVKDHKAPGEIYLVPPLDNQFDDFRLYTGAPIFINWKSHPYRDQAVLEWYHRNQVASEIYTLKTSAACEALAKLTDHYDLSYIIMRSDDVVASCSGLDEVYRDRYYVLAALPKAGAGR